MAGNAEVTIMSGGNALSMEYRVVSVDAALTINKIPHARIILQDGSWSKQNFAYSDKGDFDLGKEIKVSIRANNQSKFINIFEGVVVKHSLKKRGGDTFLIVDLKDKAVRMTTMRKTFAYQKKNDQEIIKEIITRNTDLKVDKIDQAAVKHEQMIQYNATDWDFVLARAEANGLWVIVDGGKFKLIKPKTDGTAVSTYNYGASGIHEFELQADIHQQLSEVEALSWDVTKQEAAKPAKAAKFSLSQDAKSAVAAAEKLNADTYQLASYTDLEPEEVQAWADAKIQKNRLSLFKGRIKILGHLNDKELNKTRELKPGDTIKLGGTSNYFNGNHLVSAVSHHFFEKRWIIEVQFGCSASWNYEKHQVNDVPAGGLLPGVNGLQIGVVEAFKEDPNNKFRIAVSIPSYTDSPVGSAGGSGADKKVFFARLAMPYATEEAGWFFIPEQGDEVILGFFNDDPRHPVILGSMYNPKNKMPLALSAENNQKALVLKKDETGWLFDSEEKTFELTTSKETAINIKDGESLEVKVNKESVQINKDNGISLTSENNIKLTAKEDIELEGKNIKQTAKSNHNIKGATVEIEGSDIQMK